MIGKEIQVGLLDDHQIIREGLTSLLNHSDVGIKVIWEASASREALQLAETNPPQVVITDISMPGMDGIAFADELRRYAPNVKTVVLTMYTDAELIERAMAVGIRGYALKSSPSRTVVDAIKAVCAGELFFDESIPDDIKVQARFSQKKPSTTPALTSRQLEVLKLICDGHTERQIADSLGISYHTAHAHKNNIMQRLHIHSKVDLVKYAVQKRLVQV
ncbi:MAG: response regulator transcription factor [Spirochaetales bacterium]